MERHVPVRGRLAGYTGTAGHGLCRSFGRAHLRTCRGDRRTTRETVAARRHGAPLALMKRARSPVSGVPSRAHRADRTPLRGKATQRCDGEAVSCLGVSGLAVADFSAGSLACRPVARVRAEIALKTFPPAYLRLRLLVEGRSLTGRLLVVWAVPSILWVTLQRAYLPD